MLYINEPDWLDVINHTSDDPVAVEHILALAKLKRLVIVGDDGFEYTAFEDNEGAWSKLEYHRDEEI